MADLEGITVVPEPTEERLGQRQLFEYRDTREQCLSWLLVRGKAPDRASGYARSTVKCRAYRMDQFYRWVWDDSGGYTTNIGHEEADRWLEALAQEDNSAAHKNNCLKAVQMLLKWREHEHGLDSYEPAIRFEQEPATQPRDYLTREERGAIRDAALEYGAIPAYDGLEPDERDRWRRYLAQRFEKPKSEIQPADWERANGWKIPSLVWTSLDAGLRPCEVERATTAWIDCANNVLRIPKSESAKQREHWVVGVQERTATALERWLEERPQYDNYDGTDRLWLTRKANPYGSAALKDVLQRLCEIAGIRTDNRSLSWYAIRHSVGTYMTREEDLAAAQAQLRHKSPQTTMKYDQTPVEDRQSALSRME